MQGDSMPERHSYLGQPGGLCSVIPLGFTGDKERVR